MVATFADWVAAHKSIALPVASGDPDLFLDLDFRQGEAAIDAKLVTAEGLVKYTGGAGAIWDAELGCNPNRSLTYALNNYVPAAFASRAEIGESLTIMMEVQRSAIASTWLDDAANFIDNSDGHSAACWDGSVVTAANHPYGDYTSAVQQGYFYYIAGNAAGTPFLANVYQVQNSAGNPVARMRFEHKHGATFIPITSRIHTNVVDDPAIDPIFAKVVQTINTDGWYSLYVDDQLRHRVKRTSGIQADALFYYMRIFGSAGNITNSPVGFVRTMQCIKRDVYAETVSGPREAFIGDSFIQGGGNNATPAAATVAAVNAVQNGLNNSKMISTVNANDTVIIGVNHAPWVHQLCGLANIYSLRYPFYVAGDSGHGWSNTVGVGTSQIRQYFMDALVQYDPEILNAFGSVNDVNVGSPPTDLLAETIAALTYIVSRCYNIRKVRFFQTFPGHKGSNVGITAWYDEYIRQINLQTQLDGVELTNARGNTVAIEFVPTYEKLGGDNYNPQFNGGGAAQVQDWDALYGQSKTENDLHPFQYGHNRIVEIVWPYVKQDVTVSAQEWQ